MSLGRCQTLLRYASTSKMLLVGMVTMKAEM
jgi:hypothetical protein